VRGERVPKRGGYKKKKSQKKKSIRKPLSDFEKSIRSRNDIL